MTDRAYFRLTKFLVIPLACCCCDRLFVLKNSQCDRSKHNSLK
ncbi:hypothetical protein [Dendronalium sp. ChiSLP03b]